MVKSRLCFYYPWVPSASDNAVKVVTDNAPKVMTHEALLYCFRSLNNGGSVGTSIERAEKRSRRSKIKPNSPGYTDGCGRLQKRIETYSGGGHKGTYSTTTMTRIGGPGTFVKTKRSPQRGAQ